MNRETRQLASFLVILNLVVLIGLGFNAMFQGMFGLDIYNFSNYSFIEWVAQVSYWMFILGCGVWAGSEVAHEVY